MVDPAFFYHGLKERGVRFFAGVPDSLLASFCAYIDDQCGPETHVIAANEGNAVALAAGHHLATGHVGVVYMQNSGLGNAVNPLTSLTDPEVYRIPVLLIIGWRGEPGVKDEPQHIKQGKITPALLDLLGIPYLIMEGKSNPMELLDNVFRELSERNAPVALLVRKDTFAEYKQHARSIPSGDMRREQAIEKILACLRPDDRVISTTGKTSREIYELRVKRADASRDFLTVGSMGHASSIAIGVALANPDRRVICLDGDGALLMHLGALPVVGKVQLRNLVHVLLNNGVHESVGGQATAIDVVDVPAIANACQYAATFKARSYQELEDAWNVINTRQGPILLEVLLCPGSRSDLGRPMNTPLENKLAFMRS